MTGVLLDTSVWVAFFRADGEVGVQKKVRTALMDGRVATCWPVQAELLVGARTKADFEHLRDLLSSLVQIPMGESLWSDAAGLGFELRRKGLTIPLPDLLIAQAAKDARCELWHLDRHYEALKPYAGLMTRSFLENGPGSA